MQNTIENRKITLQNLLHKSEIFNQYLQNQQTLNNILTLNHTRKHQILQFGKCQINLPQKVKLFQEPRFNCNKLMVLTKNKKQAQKIKQKYDYLQKIKQSQPIDSSLQQRISQNKGDNDMEGLNRTKKDEGNKSRLLTPQRSPTPQRIPTPQRVPTPQMDCFNSDPQFNEQVSLELTHIQQKQKPNILITKNRSNSAKVRPKFDLIMRHQKPTKQSHLSSHTRKSFDSNQPSFQNNRQKQNQFLFGQIVQQFQEEKHKKTELYEQQNPQKTQIILQQQQSQKNKVQQTQLSQFFNQQKRSTSFSIKKYNSQCQTPSLLLNKNFQQYQQQQKKNQMIFRKELHKTYNRAFVPPPKISAKSYAIYQMKKQGNKQSGKIIHAFNGKMSQQVASLTKIMTCLIILELQEKYGFDLNKEFVQIGRFQSSITGTSAEIKCGEIYTVEQLLYGLMLPSGNDASLALGVWGGKVLIQSQSECQTTRTQDNSETSSPLLEHKKYTKKDYIQRFVQQMNKKARNLQMTRTHYANTHGLVNSQNKSSAIDIVLLCEYAMNNQKFAKIVSTRNYISQIKINNKIAQFDSKIESEIFENRQIIYRNTHMLLQKRPNEYIGIKTGVTTAAGPCLASCIYNKEKDRKFIIVVLGCKTMSMRFKQTETLKRWLFKQENISMKLKKVNLKYRGGSMRDDKSEMRSQIEDEEESIDEDEISCDDKCQD